MTDEQEQPEPSFTVAQVAKAMQVSEDTIWREIRRGHIKVFRIGRLVRIRKSELDRLMEKNT